MQISRNVIKANSEYYNDLLNSPTKWEEIPEDEVVIDEKINNETGDCHEDGEAYVPLFRLSTKDAHMFHNGQIIEYIYMGLFENLNTFVAITSIRTKPTTLKPDFV